MSKSQFKPGQSGNPLGRPKAKVTTAELRAKLAKETDKIIDSVVKAALQGDTQAARLVLERIIPAFKPIEQPVLLPVSGDAGLTEQGRAVLSSVAAGELSPAQGAALVGAIGTLSRVAEIDELAKRVAALETKNVKA